jgi:hypothetical protein
MNRSVRIIILIGLLGSMVSLAHAIGYLWFTNHERTRFGDYVLLFHGDTLNGPVRSNDTIAIYNDPIFYGRVITHAPDFWHGTGYNPHFLGPPPVFNAPYFWPFTATLNCVRQCAMQQGYFYSNIGQQYLVDFHDGAAHIYRWDRGTAFDERDSWQVYPTDEGTCLFFDGPVRVKGLVSGRVTLASSVLIGIDDNLRYVDSNPFTGFTSATSPNLLALVSGGDIKINNTPANGRRNSGMPGGTSGNAQTNPDFTDVVITAAIYTLNESLTFEQQNDPDSGYVCDLSPDDRGTIYIFGGIVQERRGYFHRSSLGSTGYLKRLQYDIRLNTAHLPGICEGNILSADTVDFGDVAVGATVWDTAHVQVDMRVNVGLVEATYPFYATRTEPYYMDRFHIPVRFTPQRAGSYLGYLSMSLPGHFLQIVLQGRGVHAAAPPLVMDIAPNPFNSATLIRYTLPQAGAVRIALYDILGRQVREIVSASQEAGSQVVRMDASDLASGVYFVRLEAGSQRVMRKLMLLK